MQSKNKIGLGTFPLAGVFEKVSQSEAENIVRTFLDNGGYFIDTAPLYGFGEVESLLGEILKNYPRDQYYLITKCGKIGIEERKPIESSKYNNVIGECEKSLKRLKMDYIDLYQVHSPDPNTPFSETVEALIKLQEQGKIREIGVSNVSLEELKEYNQTGKIRSIENRFSLINRSINKEFGQYLLENEISQIPYQVIERGQLTEMILDEFQLRTEDLRNSKPDWQPERLKVIADWVQNKLYPIAKNANISLKHLAIAWALSQEFIDFVLVGAVKDEQVLNNLEANEIILGNDVLREIDSAYSELKNYIQEKHNKEIHEFRGLNKKYY
jgi:myo-inositol catabolism protein IolS